MADLKTLQAWAQIASPILILVSTCVALYLGLRDRKPRFVVTVGIRRAAAKGRDDPIGAIDLRNFGSLPVRVKAFYVSGWTWLTRKTPKRVGGVYDVTDALGVWIVEAGSEQSAPLGRLLGQEALRQMWGMYETAQPPTWFRRFPRLANLFWSVGVITAEGRRSRARLTREAVKGLRKKQLGS